MGQSSVLHVLVVETNAVPLPVVNIYAIDHTGREITPSPPWLYLADYFDAAFFTVTRTGGTVPATGSSAQEKAAAVEPRTRDPLLPVL